MNEIISATITPACRANRGDDGAWDEAVRRLRAEYDAVLAGWRDEPAQPTVRLSLHMARPVAGERNA